MSVDRAPEPVPFRHDPSPRLPDSTTRDPGFMNKWNRMTLASIVKMICVRVFIQLDHNSGVGSSKYMYLFPVCEIIYSVRIRRDDHDTAVFLPNHIVVTECSKDTRVLLSLRHGDGNERVLPLIQDDHVSFVDRSTVWQIHGKN